MSSLYGQILTAVKSQLLALPGLGITHIYRRKQPRLTERDVVPAITVHPGVEIEFEQHSENVIQYIYPVYVTLWQASNQSLEANLDQMLDWREAVRKQFHKPSPLTTLTSRIIDGDVLHVLNFETNAFDFNYDASQLELQFLSQEYRDDSSNIGTGLD